jgi:phosphatidylglycerophosphatase A
MSRTRNSPALLLLSMGGIGFLRFRPALIASAAAAAVLLGIESMLPGDEHVRAAAFGALFVVVFTASVFALRKAVPRNDVDQPYVVIDEFLGMLVALAPQLLDGEAHVLQAFITFLLFRVIDSTKPLGIRLIDKQNTPVAVLLDDVLAGFYVVLIVAGLEALMQSSLLLSAP